MNLRANLIDIRDRRIYPAEIRIADGVIASVKEISEPQQQYILPGFIDAHVHIESSLLVPSEFARMAVLHGTVATVSDPHEIANVVGMEGVEFMIGNGTQVPFHFFFGVPSCVPATGFETAGAALNAEDVEELLKRKEVLYLSEMMNYPGVIYKDEEVMKKIAAAHRLQKPVDGHAPGLSGDALRQYIAAGIYTDHECFTLNEAIEKLSLGMKVLIREGSAARNFDELIPLMNEHHEHLMFCSDDKHPDSLLEGHINQLVARALAKGHNLFDVLQAACLNPIEHYKLPVGQLRVGDPADFIITSDIENFIIDQTYIRGNQVSEKGMSLITSVPVKPVNQFEIGKKSPAHFKHVPAAKVHVIECLDGQLITNKLIVEKDQLGVANDILKIVVVNRYHEAPVAISYIKNTGLLSGAIASSVAHDSHNIVAVGVDDESICKAVNLVIEHRGGLSAVDGSQERILPLPVAGLMSAGDAWIVAEEYTALDRFAKDTLGSILRAPFMSLSFMALLVIPHLKLSDKGLFDGDTFSFVHEA